MAKFLLFVTSSPESQGAYAALQFAQAVSASKHQLTAVFFYSEGVLAANTLIAPPSDELNLNKAWQQVQLDTQCQLLVCSAAAQRRGVLTAEEAEYHGVTGASTSEPFIIAGLGEYVTLQASVDKVVQF